MPLRPLPNGQLPGAENLVSRLWQLRQAIQLFLISPDQACYAYPHLMETLVAYFAWNNNPYSDYLLFAHDDDYERWEAAHRWAQHYAEMH